MLLDAEAKAGIKLTESYAMWPGSSVSGLYIGHPDARYFGVGKIERDQVEDYARRKGWTLAEAERWLGPDPQLQPAQDRCGVRAKRMSVLLPLADIKSRVSALARVVDAPESYLPTFDSCQDGLSIESDAAYHLVYVEPGRGPAWRKTTLDIDELLYWIFEGVTFKMACAFELKHRIATEDFRRQLFKHQLGLMDRLGSRWKDRLELDLNEVLRKNPFTDTFG